MTEVKKRFDYIDQFRGFIGIMMLLGHCSYYLNSYWKQLDPFDPLFPSWGQFALRYAGYICAPGFLIMAGAMVWLSYTRNIEKGTKPGSAKWYFIQRGLFLVFIQMTIVNSSWGGFAQFNPWHLGIIAAIGISMILLVGIISFPWQLRFVIALALLLIHPFLIHIPYDRNSVSEVVIMETFIVSGDFNKYPVIPWFALAILGSVMAGFWFKIWNTDLKKILYGFSIAFGSLTIAMIIRLFRGYGNIFEYSGFGSYSFFADQKYPPSLFHNLWFFGLVVAGVTLFIIINKYLPKATYLFSVTGKVPLFFYCIHLAILGVFVKRMNICYLEGGITATFVGFIILLIIMLPLSKWFYGVKVRSKNYFIRMI